jgi:hypothetical protein
MAGNAEEYIWNLSPADRPRTRIDDMGVERGTMSPRNRMVRGGGYGQKNHNLLAWFRDKNVNPKETYSDDSGFRTVRRAN